MWRIAVEDLRNLADTFAQHERPQSIQPLLRLSARFGRSPVDFQIRRHERPNQPGPNSALMIRAITAEWVSFVTAAVLTVRRSKATQAVWRQQLALDRGDYSLRLFARKHAVVQADSENLVGPDGGIAIIAAN